MNSTHCIARAIRGPILIAALRQIVTNRFYSTSKLFRQRGLASQVIGRPIRPEDGGPRLEGRFVMIQTYEDSLPLAPDCAFGARIRRLGNA